MRLLGRPKLRIESQDGATARWLTNWIAEVRDAHWKHPADVTAQFPKVTVADDGTFLFPVLKRHVGIHVLIAFPQGVALIVALKEFDAANGH